MSKDGITEAQAEAILDYLVWLRDALMLPEWQVKVGYGPETPSSDDAFAEVEIVKHRRVAQVMVCSDFCLLPKQKQRHILIHEMVHLHLDDLKVVLDPLEHVAPGYVCEMVEDSMSHALEIATDQMAVAFGAMLTELRHPEERALLAALRRA